MNPHDLEQILTAIGQPSAWDILLGITSAVSAVASVVVAIFALSIARKAEASRDAADRALRHEREEGRLRGALEVVIQRLSEQVQALSQWSEQRALSSIAAASGESNSHLEEHLLRLSAADRSDIYIDPTSQRPRYEPLRAALGIALLAATATSLPRLTRLQSLTLTVVSAPQWHAAAQHLDDLAGAIARWGGRTGGEAHFASELDAIEAHYLDLAKQAEALREV